MTTYPERLAPHILPTAATMTGVCLTAISLVKILKQQNGQTYIDVYLALDSVLFCISVLLSYASMRWAGRRRAPRYERIADYVFSLGMVVMVGICVLFAFDLA